MKKCFVLMVAILLMFLFVFTDRVSADSNVIMIRINIEPGPLRITSIGNLVFPSLTLDGEDHELLAIEAPIFTLTIANGIVAGWNVTFQSSDFLSDSGAKIPAGQFKFSSGGVITRVGGQEIDFINGPRETGLLVAPLNLPVKVLTANLGYGRGKYIYSPNPTDFSFSIPADQPAGTYNGVFTATISMGP